MKKIFITGGAGYVGSKLVPKLLESDYDVTVFDLMIYGENVLDNHEKLKKIKGDIRNKDLLKKLYDSAKQKDLDVIVEVHDHNELDIALDAECDIIGINNRNLHTFEVDLKTTTELVQYINKDQLIITESGIHTSDDVKKMNDCGINTFLVGESLMISKDPINKFKEIFIK